MLRSARPRGAGASRSCGPIDDARPPAEETLARIARSPSTASYTPRCPAILTQSRRVVAVFRGQFAGRRSLARLRDILLSRRQPSRARATEPTWGASGTGGGDLTWLHSLHASARPRRRALREPTEFNSCRPRYEANGSRYVPIAEASAERARRSLERVLSRARSPERAAIPRSPDVLESMRGGIRRPSAQLDRFARRLVRRGWSSPRSMSASSCTRQTLTRGAGRPSTRRNY